MLLNSNVVLVGKGVTLVPYEKHHVETYHRWMQNPKLLELTASEPLSLKEEFDMQRKWATDKDKLTFIILSNELIFKCKSTENEKEIKSMIGDVNIFLNDESENCGEIEIMIAEEKAKRKGFALEALNIMMAYCQTYLNMSTFIAKIGTHNLPSLNLFKNKLGFDELSVSDVFKEMTLFKQLNQNYNEKKIKNTEFQQLSYKEWKMSSAEQKN